MSTVQTKLTKEEILKRLREHKAELQKKFPIASLALFGSYAREDHTDDSDVDLLVEFNGPIGWEMVDLVEEFERMFQGKKVDLISKKFLKPRYRDYIEKDLINV